MVNAQMSDETRALLLYAEMLHWLLERMRGNPAADAHLHAVINTIAEEDCLTAA